MRITARVILVVVLACGLGCARSDWIDRTLVTVDVTGVWEGSAPTSHGQAWFQFNLEQQGAQVKGLARGWGIGAHAGGPGIIGGVAGDVFTFRGTDDSRFTGEMTVSGDEMTGRANVPYAYGPSTLTLRRVGSSSPPSSPRP